VPSSATVDVIEGEEKQFRLTAAGALATVVVEAHIADRIADRV